MLVVLFYSVLVVLWLWCRFDLFIMLLCSSVEVWMNFMIVVSLMCLFFV